MVEIVYIFTVVVLGYIFIKTNRELKEKYYLEKLPFFGTGNIPFLPLLFPKKYFIKEELWDGYIVYLFNFFSIVGIIYFLFKLWSLIR